MAGPTHGDTPDFDMTEHEHTWRLFNRLFVWGIVLVVLILLLLIWAHFG